MAYWLKGKQENVIYLWLLFILGFIFTIFLNNDFTTLLELMQSGQRVDLSIKNAQWDSMLAGTSLLMSVFLFYATLKSSNTLKVKLSFLALLSLFIMLFSYLVLVTQSRQIWLGLVSIAIAGPLIYLVLNKGKNIKVVLFSLAGVALLLFLLGNSQTVQKRLSQEHETVHSLIQNQESIKMSSIGIRINSWLEAKDWIVRHPILGLDSKAIPEVIRQSDRFDESFKKQFGHLHNFFIETLVAYGFSGFLLILAMYYLIIKSISESSLKESEKKYYLLAGISFSIYWLIINNFESFNSRSLGIFTHNVIFASFYTFYITAYLNQSDKKEVL
ncbi:MAG: O-antigen ligase family protein [Campylobacterota bacterium]|nr:O-antigen ligase family protein [Campylobacterota bacterium]